MTIEKKLLGTSPSGDSPDVAEVFSTHLYTGNSGTNAINNGIDLAGEGGMVWFKCRNVTNNHYIVDTQRGASKVLYGLGTAAEATSANSVTSFNSNGLTLGADDTDGINKNTRSQVAWTFRKKSGFFDCLTYTGDGTTGRSISHALDGPVGMIICKKTSDTGNWNVLHRSVSLSGSPAQGLLRLNTTAGSTSYSSNFNETFPTDSVFYVSHIAGASNQTLNTTGETYVAYVFADNSAEDADDQMIKCGYYFGTGSTHEVALGWEPQFLLVKSASSSASWRLLDTMRGFIAPPSGNEDSKLLFADTNGAEDESGSLNVSSNGFIVSNDVGHSNAANQLYIYLAIRAPMMREPSAATDVFSVLSTSVSNGASFVTGFPYDLNIMQYGNGGEAWGWQDRLRGFAKDANTANQILSSNLTNPEYILDAVSGHIHSAVNTGGKFGPYFNGATAFNWAWKRAKSFFDIVGFTGNGTSGTAYNHSLSVIPEMVILKNRSRSGTSWRTWALSELGDKELLIDTSAAAINSTILDVTASTFTINAGNSHYNRNGDQYIVYLFATLAGISKVGSYTGNGTSQNINCGFSSGARFILIKRAIGGTGNWLIYDSVRGITSSANSVLNLNNLDGAASINHVQPHSSGFSVTYSNSDVNASGNTYLFYAIA